MPINWLINISNFPSKSVNSTKSMITFNKDKEKLDLYFEKEGYGIIRIKILERNSYKIPGKNIFILGSDFFEKHKDIINKNTGFLQSSLGSTKDTKKLIFKRRIFNQLSISLSCIKDIVQKIGNVMYIYPDARDLMIFFKLLGYNIIPDTHVSEGGTFLKGIINEKYQFLIVSYDFVEYFKNLNIPILRAPPNIGELPENTHIDILFGIINFNKKRIIAEKQYNGIFYVHFKTYKKIQEDIIKKQIWESLKNKLNEKKYLIRIYTPETKFQNIGINFKFDVINNKLLTNAFPIKERKFLGKIGISVIAPEYSFSTNNYESGGVNCSYLIEKKIKKEFFINLSN